MNEVIIDGCNVLEERKFLIHTDKYSIGEDGLIDRKIPFIYMCYDLALQLQRAKAELEQYKNDIASGVGCIQCKKELENDTLHITIEKLKGDLYIAEDSLRDYIEHYNKLEAENEKLKLMLSEKYGVYK